MRDDEKMYIIGVTMVCCVVCLVAFLQVCYRVQDNNLRSVRQNMEDTLHAYDVAGTKFSALSSSGALRKSVLNVNPRAETVSFSKTVHIDDIPMVE